MFRHQTYKYALAVYSMSFDVDLWRILLYSLISSQLLQMVTAKQARLSVLYKFICIPTFTYGLIRERDTIRGVQVRAGAVYIYVYGGMCAIIVAHAMHT